MVYVSKETPYMKLFKDFLAHKHKLVIDAWGADESPIQHIYQPLIDHIKQEIPEKYQNLYPWPVWKLENRVGRLGRNILVAEFLVQEWADHFQGKDGEEELDAIARSFAFDQCLHRDSLNRVLKDNAKLFADNDNSA
jgi:hypothetical protein